MLVIGLTGSIGMGKSTIAERFREKGIAVFDADAEVHRLYESDAAPLIEDAFPGTTVDGRVDRLKLSASLLADPSGFAKLEAIVHPLVRAAEKAFLDKQAASSARFAVLEIPLLFETGADDLVDVTIVVSAGADIQRERVLARPGMTPEKLNAILARQLSDTEKRKKADFVVDTSGEIAASYAELDDIVGQLADRHGEAYHRRWK